MSRPVRRSALRQSFSYHRLRSHAVAARVVASTGLAPPGRVYEFGAGDGVLSCALAPLAGHLTAIEIDRALHHKLTRLTACLPNVEAVHADFRDYPLPRHGDYSVVANLPFSLTAETLRHLLHRPNPPAAAFLIVQREAAATWTGAGRTSLRAVHTSLRFAFDVPLALRRGDFDPWPRVESVLLAVRRRDRPLLNRPEARAFEEFTTRGFTRGAPVARNLRGVAPGGRLLAALHTLAIPPDAGPASLSPAQWLELWTMLRC